MFMFVFPSCDIYIYKPKLLKYSLHQIKRSSILGAETAHLEFNVPGAYLQKLDFRSCFHLVFSNKQPGNYYIFGKCEKYSFLFIF